MAEGVISDLIAKALASLAKAVSKEAVSWWSVRDDLKKLESTMTFIQARVRDAERRQEGENSELIKLWLRKLKQVLYRADDLFDLVLTLNRQNLQAQRKSMMVKVGVLFSKSGPLFNNRKIALEIKSIRKELDAIKSNMKGLNLSANLVVGLPSPMQLLIGKRQTASFVKAEDVIGRENDKNIIIGMLLNHSYDDEKKITVIPIVGFGGIGKTTLAQLIFNDEGVQNHFDLTTWVCVPEVDDRHTVMRRVYQSFTGDKDSDKLLNSQIVIGIQQLIINKKYLLVLDDIWDEKRENWLGLLKLLDCGAKGSRVIVTTRSANVAKAVGTTKAHDLRLLTNEDSWNLFVKFAFQTKQDESNLNLTRIGLEIVDTCRNVPLAILVVGSLLYCDNSEEHWQRIRDARLSKAKGKEDDSIMQALKLSYDYLPPAYKQCFAYCSLFPKDYIYNINDLVKLWMAQGYIDPSSTDNGENCFMVLLRRNLFQDPKVDVYGTITGYKMHDSVHDLAQHIAGEEIKQLGDPLSQLLIIDDGIMHVRVTLKEDQWEAPESLLHARNLRSLMLCPIYPFKKALSLEVMLLKFQFLRSLDLKGMEISMVSNCIGKLRHLRYLNLASNHSIEFLPANITKLENLQTLDLRWCLNLKELPRDFCKLTNLMHLSIFGCDNLIDLPSGFGKLASLKKLDLFRVGKNNGIDSLPALSLIGNLHVEFGKRESDIVMEAQRAKLKDNQQLTCLGLAFRPDFGETNEMLKCLQLPPNLKEIDVRDYKGVEMPRRWLDELSKLVDIRILGCSNCRVLPRMSQLPHLKKLDLDRLDSLEYIEDEDGMQIGDGGEKHGPGAHNDYFPSLEVLSLWYLGSLKGWTRPSKDDGGEPRQLMFPRLSQLTLEKCPNLMSMPQAPKLESLEADVINWKWLVSNPMSNNCEDSSSTTLFPSQLKELQISGIEDAKSINLEEVFQSIACITTLQKLQINEYYLNDANNLKQLPEEMGKLSLLRELQIYKCPKLASLPQSLLDLTSLQKLKIWSCPELKERYEKPNGQDCLLLQHIPNVLFDKLEFD